MSFVLLSSPSHSFHSPRLVGPDIQSKAFHICVLRSIFLAVSLPISPYTYSCMYMHMHAFDISSELSPETCASQLWGPHSTVDISQPNRDLMVSRVVHFSILQQSVTGLKIFASADGAHLGQC